MRVEYAAAQFIGAKHILVDIEKDSLCLDPDLATKAVEQYRPKALIYVSLNGRWHTGVKLQKLFQLCRERNVAIIEDAAQAFGSENLYGKIGSQADITTFSFSPHKIITTGQGGAIVTNDTDLARHIELLKDFGRESGGQDFHPEFGINSKFTDLQAVIGREQLKSIDERITRKKEIYSTYHAMLEDIPEIFWVPTDTDMTIPWFVDIYTDLRDGLMEYLQKKDIKTRMVYPTLDSQPCFYDDVDTSSVASYFSRRGATVHLTRHR